MHSQTSALNDRDFLVNFEGRNETLSKVDENVEKFKTVNYKYLVNFAVSNLSFFERRHVANINAYGKGVFFSVKFDSYELFDLVGLFY